MSSFKSKLKLYSDENIPDKVIELLEKEGFDVKRAPFRSDDEEIAKEAMRLASHKLPIDTRFVTREMAVAIGSGKTIGASTD